MIVPWLQFKAIVVFFKKSMSDLMLILTLCWCQTSTSRIH